MGGLTLMYMVLKRGVYVSPLKEEIVTSPKQVMKIIQKGESNRHFGSTDYNEHSSRSHTIFQMVGSFLFWFFFANRDCF